METAAAMVNASDLSHDTIGVLDRVVVCGSRNWPADWNWFITAEMIRLFEYRHTHVIAGGAQGVDRHAAAEAARLGYPYTVVKADWSFKTGVSDPNDLRWRRDGTPYDVNAGKRRNLEMLDMNPDLVLAFQWAGSPGTRHTVSEARKRGIPVVLHTKLPAPDLASLDTDHEVIGDML